MLRNLAFVVGVLTLGFAAFHMLGTADAQGIGAHTRVTPDRGDLLYSGITGTTGGSANTVVTTTKDTVILAIENATDKEVMVTNGSTDLKRMPANTFRQFDMAASGVSFGGQTYKAYYTGAAGTTGHLEILALPYR